MGLTRFAVSPPDRITDEVLQQAYLAGMERVPWRVRVAREGGHLVLERNVSESANLNIPWDVPGHGRVTLATGSLMETPEPHLLPLELARGKLAQLRNQLADWQVAGLNLPEEIKSRTAQAVRQFSRAAVRQGVPAESAELAEQSLRMALDAADLLVGCYTEQVIALRRRNGAKLPTLLAGDLGSTPLDEATAVQFRQAFNAACLPMSWRGLEISEGVYEWDICDQQVQWCQANGLRVYAGPVVQLDRRSVPDWLYVWDGEFGDILSFVSEYVEAVVRRYRGKVHVWQCAGRLNTSELLSLTEEESLRLAARVVEIIRGLDPDTPRLLSFDQPWAEYLSRRDMDFPPLHFADALLRAGMGLAGLMLEINLGYYPHGTLPRDPLEFSRELDHWNILGLPLHVSLCVPSSDHPDPLAQVPVQPVAGDWTPQSQQAWVSRYVPLILAKPYVQGIAWSQLRDYEPHDFPHGGLIDLRRQPKPALHALATIRQTHLR
jgi:hypothetical protein